MTKKELSNNDALFELFKSSLEFNVKSDKLDIEAIQHEISYHEQLVKWKLEEEPISFFKKAHKKWKEELDELETQLLDSYKKLERTIEEQHNFYNKLRSEN